VMLKKSESTFRPLKIKFANTKSFVLDAY